MHHFVELLCLCSKSFDQGCWLLYLTFDMHLLYFWGHNQRIMSNAPLYNQAVIHLKDGKC